MHQIIMVAAAFAAGPQATTVEVDETIVVTASREPVAAEEAPLSVTIFGRDELEALALPMTSDVLQLAPGISVSASGPRGSQTQLRIRGAEANHTLLFVDGIRFNDPAAGNEARLELLTNDALSRLEIVRGPQSALWGSEALGGVIALETANPLRDRGVSLLGEYGSLDSARASAHFGARTGNVGLSGSAGWLGSDGIDAFGSGGERDGFDNRSASLKGVFSPLPLAEIGFVGHHIEGTSEFDGFDPATFRRSDTLDETENRLSAVRAWASTKLEDWALSIDGSYLASANRNKLADASLNSTFGKRFAVGGQASRTFGRHHLVAAVEHEGEDFRARDRVYLGGTDQDRSRELTALIGQWRAEWSGRFITDLAVRHDSFSAFDDATTFRAAVLFRPAPQWTLHASYGEGIAQPTFYDLFGFFPGSFVGNPELRPESSKGWEAGVRWTNGKALVAVTGFGSHLRDEIVDIFDPVTFISSTENATGKSRRRGVEAEATYRFGSLAALSFNYTYLDADQQQVAGSDLVREARRPRHSANALVTGTSGPLSWGASIAYVGERQDTDFESFPARQVTLDDYLLGSLNLAWRVRPELELYGRVENAFDADYEDAFGYRTAGRTVYAGLRVRLGR